MLINKYHSIRSYITDAIILLRHSDFYYCFEEDAELFSDLFNCAIAYDDEFDID